jgi:hypothetical protein
MDGAGPLNLTQLRSALAAFDDEALAALANKGLVRRARKDLETTRPTALDPEGEYLRLEVGDAVVELALPPTNSRCSCPAGGICRHILTALIFVKESEITGDPTAGPLSASPSAAEELLAVDDESLSRWAGKAFVARASKSLAFGLLAEFEEAGAIIVRFPSRNVACRWMPGGGLAGMVCSCHAPGPCEHRVAAVLAFQVARGVRARAEAGPEALEASAEAPRTREGVLAAVGGVLGEVALLGTSRLSRATAERLRTLSASAHGVDLPLLERLLRTLAAEVELVLARDAQADATRLLGVAARVEALRHGLARPPSALVGEHRTAYDLVGDIELIGLGARRWRTRSGYMGLTVSFWDRSARAWATWTDARPTTTGGLDPLARYRAEGPWTGLVSPAQASRSSLRLTGAWRNRYGRLSGRPSTRAIVTGPADPAEAPTLARWSEIGERAARVFGGGFSDRGERDELVLLAPTAWGPAQFDAVRQEVVRPILDAEGCTLSIVLSHTPENLDAVNALESFEPSGAHSLLGLLRLDAGRLTVEPIAIHSGPRVFNLTLDTARQAPQRRADFPTRAGEDEDESEGLDPDEGDPPPSSSTGLRLLLNRLASLLEVIGEGGFAAFRAVEDLRAWAARAEAVGLTSCARPVQCVAGHIERQRRGETIDADRAAHDLLRAYYVVRLAAAQESVATATACLGS